MSDHVSWLPCLTGRVESERRPAERAIELYPDVSAGTTSTTKDVEAP